ncbi:hypothetical protein BU197_23105 [Streptomyces sp. CBMA291]|nr:hypothetical protein [Streptomyces sp. CBMA291]MBD0714186.1 hypothetical protein [Streptomyces sp. CBMA370]
MEQVSAGKKLDQAFEKLGKEKSLSFELDLDADAATLKALDAASDPEPGEEIPDEAAKLISGAKISVTVESRKPIAESEEKDFVGTAVKFSTPSGDLVEFRSVDDFTYIRADVKSLSKMMGAPLPGMDDLPPEAADLKKVVEGAWVKFRTAEMAKFGEDIGAEASATPSPEPTLDAKTQKKLLDSLREVVARKVEFSTSGGKGDTEHVTATAPVRTLLGELLTEIRPLAKNLPPSFELPSDKDLKEIPDTRTTADFTLKNGALTEVYVDLAKLAENAKVKKFGLSLKMSAGVKPTAPAGATELNPEELMGGLLGFMMPADEFGESDLSDEEDAEGTA